MTLLNQSKRRYHGQYTFIFVSIFKGENFAVSQFRTYSRVLMVTDFISFLLLVHVIEVKEKNPFVDILVLPLW